MKEGASSTLFREMLKGQFPQTTDRLRRTRNTAKAAGSEAVHAGKTFVDTSAKIIVLFRLLKQTKRP